MSSSSSTRLDTSRWVVWTCSCGTSEHVPYAPPDGLCAACRDAADGGASPAVEELLRRSGAPPRYAGLTRASWEAKYGPWSTDPVMKTVMDWTGTGEDWLVLLYGPAYGQRKTGAATALLGEQLVRGRRGVWIDQADWVRRLRAGWSRGGGVASEEEVFRRAADAEVLLIDDIGAVSAIRDNAYYREQVAEVIRYREANEAATLATLNADRWTDIERLHPSLVSRCDVRLRIKFAGTKDHRRGRR